MSNELIYILMLLGAFSFTVFTYKLGKVWLYSWLATAAVLSIPTAGIIVTIFGFAVNAGMALYSCLFLGTDMITERYGKKAARTAVNISVFAIVAFIVVSELTIALTPESYSTATYDALKTLFGMSTRIAVAAIVSYAVAQYLDIMIYHALSVATAGKLLWLRNNVSTMLTQVLDNFLFFSIAFYGIFPNWVELFIVATIVRIFISLLDTPFIYLAQRVVPQDEVRVVWCNRIIAAEKRPFKGSFFFVRLERIEAYSFSTAFGYFIRLEAIK